MKYPRLSALTTGFEPLLFYNALKKVFCLLFFITSINAYCEEKLIEITLPQSQNLEESESSWLCSQVRDVLSEEIRENTDFVPTSSAEIENQILALQKKSESVAFDENSAIEMGKLVSAKFALFSVIRKAKSEYFLSVTISDLTTGKTLVNATSASRKSAENLFLGEKSAMSEIMQKLLKQLGIKSKNQKNQPEQITQIAEMSEKNLSEEQKKAEDEKRKKRFLEMKFRHTDSLLTEYTGSDEVVIIPDFICKIDFAAFRQSTLKNVIFHECVSEIGREAFSMSSLKKIEIPETVTQIEKRAFAQCVNLKKATINANVDAIPEQCFSGCSSLKEVEIRNGIETLRKGAFNSCTSLERIVIPESVEYIGDFCFSGCSNLKEVVIKNPACVIGERAFYGTPYAMLNEKY